MKNETYHILNDYAINNMKDNVTILHTSNEKRLVSTAMINGLKSGKAGYFGTDVYEEEEKLFFTNEAVENIARATLANIREYLETGKSENELSNA